MNLNQIHQAIKSRAPSLINKLETLTDSNDFSSYYPERLKNLIKTFANHFPQKDVIILRAPGRVNLIGEHTDYNGYPVLPMAIDRDIWVCAALNDSHKINFLNTLQSFAHRSFSTTKSIQPYPSGDWGNYVKAAVNAFIDQGKTGFNAVFDGNIPPAAGLSSSSALVVAAALTFLQFNEIQLDKLKLADILAQAEHFVGTAGGGMDQAVSLMGQKNKAIKIDFFPLRISHVPLPKEYAIVICNSLIKAPKTEHALHRYNRRPIECRLATALIANELKKQTKANRLADIDMQRVDIDKHQYQILLKNALFPPIQTMDDITKKLGLSQSHVCERFLKLDANTYFHPPKDGFKLEKRYNHVISEKNRVEQAAQALSQGNIIEFGHLMNDSHASCRDNYEISTPELDFMVKIAHKYNALGARLTGAGFGGCTVNLVHRSDVELFINGMVRDYYQTYLDQTHPDLPKQSSKDVIFTTRATNGAEVIIDQVC